MLNEREIGKCDTTGENGLNQIRHMDLHEYPMLEAIQKSTTLVEDCKYMETGRRTCSTRTWQKIGRLGFIGAVEDTLRKSDERTMEGFDILVRNGWNHYLFEVIVVSYPNKFAKDVVEIAWKRINTLL